MSWIHEKDMNRLFERGLTNTEMRGVYVASAPHPVSQVEFMRELRRVAGMPIGLPASPWMVRFGAKFLLRTDPDLALYGRYVHSKRLEQECFEFCHPTIREALQDL
jgi:NAD dependent epimerase/dehydratase family enzyme